MLTYYDVNRAEEALYFEKIRSSALEDQLRKVKSEVEMKEINSYINQIISLKRLEIKRQKDLQALKKEKEAVELMKHHAVKMQEKVEREKVSNTNFFFLVMAAAVIFMTAAVVCSIYLTQQLNIAKDQKAEVTQVKAAKVEEPAKRKVKQTRRRRESVFEMGKPASSTLTVLSTNPRAR